MENKIPTTNFFQCGQQFFGELQHLLNYANAIGNDELYRIVEETIKQGYALIKSPYTQEPVEPVTKQWEPKPGEYQQALMKRVSYNNRNCVILFNTDDRAWIKFDAGDEQLVLIDSLDAPLQKSLREQISEILFNSPHADNDKLDRIMEVVGRSKE